MQNWLKARPPEGGPTLTLVNILYANIPLEISILVSNAPKDRTIINLAEMCGLSLEDEVDWDKIAELDGQLKWDYFGELNQKYKIMVVTALRQAGIDVVNYGVEEIDI